MQSVKKFRNLALSNDVRVLSVLQLQHFAVPACMFMSENQENRSEVLYFLQILGEAGVEIPFIFIGFYQNLCGFWTKRDRNHPQHRSFHFSKNEQRLWIKNIYIIRVPLSQSADLPPAEKGSLFLRPSETACILYFMVICMI